MIAEEESALNNIEEWSIICYGRISFFVVDSFIFVYESDAFFILFLLFYLGAGGVVIAILDD